MYCFHHSIPFSKITDGLYPALQKAGNVFKGVATLKIHGDWMLGQYDACLFLRRL
jgi:hypothetical protein